MNQPLVSIICIAYKQASFVKEAIDSVLNQTYANLELILVDNASHDGTAEIMKAYQASHLQVQLLFFQEKINYTRVFNQALKLAKGEFVIDLAADDILLPNRVEVGINDFEQGGAEVGVHFSDAQLINEQGENIGLHSDQFPHNEVPQGEIYSEVLARYFILSPTMMMRRSVLDQLQGYDESLAYEDFDFWIRSAQICQYAYCPQVLVKKRLRADSLFAQQVSFWSPQLKSTLRVCRKAYRLNRNQKEHRALLQRILFEAWQTTKVFRIDLSINYALLFVKAGIKSL